MKTRQLSEPKSAVLSKSMTKVKVSKVMRRDRANFKKTKSLRTLHGENSNISKNSVDSFIDSQAKELPITNILKAIDDLSSEPDHVTKQIIKCSSRMVLKTDIFWTSPTAILRAIKYSILRRNWDDVTHLLLLLLQHKDHYISIVQNICGFMARFNPLVKKLGLQEQFEILNIKRREVSDPNSTKQESEDDL